MASAQTASNLDDNTKPTPDQLTAVFIKDGSWANFLINYKIGDSEEFMMYLVKYWMDLNGYIADTSLFHNGIPFMQWKLR